MRSPAATAPGLGRRDAGATMAAASSGATVAALLALTKPRVISLLLFTTMATMIAAASGWPGTALFAATLVGGYLAAGAANTINMLMDRDIDAKMDRTAERPLVTNAVTVGEALWFVVAQATVSFGLLWGVANLLTAVLALAGLIYYVIIYTLWLKRRSHHNIVIGGAAGAIPPLVGWSAVHGDLGALAWVLFAIVFVWTPVHFWALAILIKDDYARVGVPMLPVVGGDRATALQIGAYGVATVAASLAPVALGEAGVLYLLVVLALNASLAARVVRLVGRPDRVHARGLFKYSLVYLAALFLALAVDRSLLPHSSHPSHRSHGPLGRSERRAVTRESRGDRFRGYWRRDVSALSSQPSAKTGGA